MARELSETLLERFEYRVPCKLLSDLARGYWFEVFLRPLGAAIVLAESRSKQVKSLGWTMSFMLLFMFEVEHRLHSILGLAIALDIFEVILWDVGEINDQFCSVGVPVSRDGMRVLVAVPGSWYQRREAIDCPRVDENCFCAYDCFIARSDAVPDEVLVVSGGSIAAFDRPSDFIFETKILDFCIR